VAIYDSLYVALAERRDTAMVTAAEGLIRRLSGDAGLAKRMVWVGDLLPDGLETAPRDINQVGHGFCLAQRHGKHKRQSATGGKRKF
jgi:hypothetical protein